ncbi:MAG: FISUMP domain-containing protein [Ekhidna sp.]|uniref:FISUMP domain-containing protein n=1 Tax=Ekhidna sp. TaxID=2608089 RepID=UPI0032EB7D02
MKNLLPYIFFLLSLSAVSQGFQYQAVVRKIDGSLLKDEDINIMVKLKEGLEGVEMYTEIHEVSTDQLGRVEFVIGEGGYKTADFESIDWSKLNTCLEILIDRKRNSDYVSLGTLKLQPVPYALFALSSGDGLTQTTQIIQGEKTFIAPINGVLRGGVVLSDAVPALAGAIKWNGTDFVGFNGEEWISLSSGGGQSSNTFDCGEIFIDPRDGSEYRTVLMGSECWFAENLRFQTEEGSYQGTGSYSIENAGLYYTWAGVMNISESYNSSIFSLEEPFQGACPSGWHVSTHQEWLNLEALEEVNGLTLQEGGGSGFDAKLVGDRLQNGSFSNTGISAVFWTSSEVDARNSYKRILFDGEIGVGIFVFEKDYGFCVRCVKD